MTTERIDIVITDKVDASAEQKLLNLAKASRDAFTSVSELQASLSKGGNTASFDRMAAAAARQELAQAKLAAISQKVQLAQEKVATQAQKTGAAYLQSEAALNRAILAEQKATAATTAAATQQQRLATEVIRTAQAETAAATAAERLATAQARTALVGAQTAATQARAAVSAQSYATATQRTVAANFAADTSYQRLQASVIKTAQAQTQATTATTAQATAVQRLAAATAQADAAQSRASAAALRLQQSQARASSGGSGLVGSLLQVSGAIFGVSKAYDLLMSKFDETQAYTNLQNKLRLVASSTEQVQTLTNDLLQAANRSRAPLEEFGTTFQRINGAIVQVGGSQKEAIKITEALTKTISVSGKSVSEQASALLQVSQAFNKGKLDGDEFRTVMEVLPEFADKLTVALGLANRAALFEASKNGKINLDAMREAMRLMGDEADKNLSKSVITVEQGFTRLKNSSTVLVGRLDEALGITRLLSRALDGLANATERAATAQDGATPTQALQAQEKILATLDKQIEAKQSALLQDKAGVAGANALARLEQTRANVLATIQELKGKESVTQSDDILARKASEQQARNAKAAADGAKAAADKEKADKEQEKRDASRRRSFEAELQGLREKTAMVGELTELEKVEASIAAGKYKGVAKPSEINEIKDLAAKRDAQAVTARLDKEILADQQKLFAAREQNAAALEQETFSLQAYSDALTFSEGASVRWAAATQADKAASIEFQAELLKSITGVTSQTEALDRQAAAIRRNSELQQEIVDKKFVNQETQPGGLLEGSGAQKKSELDRQQEIFDQLARLEAAKTITAEEGENARYRIRIASQQRELATAQTFFGGLEQLSNSKNKSLSRIGKTAAIANATIKGYEAVQNALAVQPFYLGLALAAVAGTAAASNIQAIRSTGYQQGGYTGDYGLSTPVGTVHGREFVVNAEGTRNNRAQLETLNRGGTLKPSNSSPNITVNNLGTPQEYRVESITEDRITVIATDIANKVVTQKAPGVVAANMNEPSSVMSKSMQRNTQAGRKR